MLDWLQTNCCLLCQWRSIAYFIIFILALHVKRCCEEIDEDEKLMRLPFKIESMELAKDFIMLRKEARLHGDFRVEKAVRGRARGEGLVLR